MMATLIGFTSISGPLPRIICSYLNAVANLRQLTAAGVNIVSFIAQYEMV